MITDVGSSTVSAGLVLFSPNKKVKPKILFTTFVPISVTPEPDLAHLSNFIGGYVKTAFATLATKGLVELKTKNIKVPEVSKIFVSLSSPWFVSKTTKRTIANSKPFVFEEHLISTTLTEEEVSFESEAREETRMEFLGTDVRMIEREVVHVSLNGYHTANPFGREANRADVSLYMSLASEKLLREIRDAAREYFHRARGVFHTFPLVSFGSLNELFPQMKDYVFFDIAGEDSHLFLSKGGAIQSTVSFPLGENALLRRIMANHTVDETLARSSIALWKDGTAGAALKSPIDAVISEYQNEWILQCKKALQILNGTASHWFLIADMGIEAVFVSFLQAIVAQGERVSAITALGAADFKDVVDTEKHVDRDPFLALQTLFANIHGGLYP